MQRIKSSKCAFCGKNEVEVVERMTTEGKSVRECYDCSESLFTTWTYINKNRESETEGVSSHS